MVLGDVCMDFEPYFKVHNLVSVHPKSIILGEMTNLNMIFQVCCEFIDWLKFETRPSSLLKFGILLNWLYLSHAALLLLFCCSTLTTSLSFPPVFVSRYVFCARFPLTGFFWQYGVRLFQFYIYFF